MESKVFDGIWYLLLEKSVKNASEVKQLMRKGGALQEFFSSELVTHIISDDQKSTAELVTPSDAVTVHSDWVRMSSRCGAVLPTAPFELRDDKLFSGLVFCSSKLPRSDREKLCALVAYYGGRIQRRLNAMVTHLITMEMAGPKYECATQRGVKVVTPDWILDCIDLGKRLEEGDYHPSGLQYLAESRGAASPACNGETNGGRREGGAAEKQAQTVVVTSGQVVNVSELLQQKEAAHDSGAAHRLSTHSEEEQQASSKEGVPEAEEAVGVLSADQSRSTRDGPVIVATEKSVLESSALPPKDHKTTAAGPERQSHVETATRDSKTVAEESTPVLKQTKPECPAGMTAALSPILMPAVLGESRTSAATPDSPRLLQGMVFYFTDYQECMDKESITKWKEVVVQHGGEVLEEYDPLRCTHLLALHKKSDTFAKVFADSKCIASAHWLNDVLTEQKMFPPKHALHLPTAFKWQLPGAENHALTLTNYTGTERDLVKDMIRITGIPYTGFLSRETTHLICKSPEGKKYEKAVEWGVQVVNASFLADVIHNGQVPAVLFPRHTTLGTSDEFSITGFEATRLLKPWEVFLEGYSQLHLEWVDQEATQTALQGVSSPGGKRGRREGEEEEKGGGEQKKPRLTEATASLPATEPQSERRAPPTVLFTGISQNILKKLRPVVQKLGGRLTEKPRECTCIVAPRVARTVKFLSAISVCEHVVTPEWVEESGRAGRFVEEGPYTLRDSDAEAVFVMDVPTSLRRAHSKKLLQGLYFHATPRVQPPHGSLRDIIESAGGELLTRVDLRSRFGQKFEHLGEGSSPQLLVLSCPEDVASGQCSEFFRHDIAVYNAEFVLTGVLRQELDYSENKLVQE